MITRRDASVLALLAALPLLLLAPTLVGDRVLFLNDLTHISRPWRGLTAELLQRGRLPLWNPYAYFGLPLAGNLQTGWLDPLGLVFQLFPFAKALSPFLLFAYWLASLFGYLWLRRLGATRGAAGAGALLFAAGGTMVSHAQFPNVLSTLAWGPGLFLFTGRFGPAALAAGCAFLAGYPPAWAGLVGSWLLLQLGFGGGRRAGPKSAAAALAGLALAGAVLVPGLELIGSSGRGRGVSPGLRMRQSMDAPDLLSTAHPELTRALESRGKAAELQRVTWTYGQETATFTWTAPSGVHVEDPAGSRYTHLTSGYLGVTGAAAALAGLLLLAMRRPAPGLAAGLFVAATLLLCLGANHPASAWLWTHAPYLKQLRGPARMSYLLLAVAPLLVALALDRLGKRRALRPWAAAAAALIAVELGATGWGFHPTLPADYYAGRGPLVDYLRERLDGLRYFMIPETELWPHVHRASEDPRFARLRELTYRTYKEKLFGLSQLPFHLEAASGGYEPLVPAGVERAVETIRTSGESRSLAAMLAWLGCRFVLAKGELPPHLVGHEEALLPGRLLDRGTKHWQVYETSGNAARARWLPEKEGGRLAGPLEGAGEPVGAAWAFLRPREDGFEAIGTAPESGRLFVAEPHYPGWKAYVNGREEAIERALEGFSQVHVPPGEARVVFVYRPWSATMGAALTVLALAILALWGEYLHRRADFNSMSVR